MLYQLVFLVWSLNGCQTGILVTDGCCWMLNDPQCPLLNCAQRPTELSVLHQWWTGGGFDHLYVKESDHWLWSVMLWVLETGPVRVIISVIYQCTAVYKT